MNTKFTKYFTSCKGVFQGGGCKAIAYIGAYKKAYERGVFFSELAGTSAGSIIAALIACGAKPEYLETIVKNIDFKDFISDYEKAKWWQTPLLKCILPKQYRHYAKYLSLGSLKRNYGIFKINVLENFIDNHLRQLTGLQHPVTFNDLIPNLHVISADLEKHTIKVWNKENTPTESIAKAVCCSCCIPFFFQPVEKRYVDGGLLSNLPSFIFAEEPHYNRILNFKLEVNNLDRRISSFYGFLLSIFDTIIEGACNIQQNLSCDLFDVSIKLEDISAIDFDRINTDVIENLISKGEEAMSNFLDEELTFISNRHHTLYKLQTKEQMRSLVSYISLERHKEIYVSCESTYWCWELFLSLVRWITDETKVTVIVSSTIPEKYKEVENARRRMLKAMGCNLITKDGLPLTGYFFMEKKGVWKGIIFNEDDTTFSANYYCNSIDSDVIKEVVLKLTKERLTTVSRPNRITIRPIEPSKIINRLKTEIIYKDADLKFETVNLEDLHFMNPYIRALKYKQIDKMYELYENGNIVPFSAAALYFGKKESIICPPVAERHNGKLYIIEGNTRCVYAYRHGIHKLKIIVVDNVITPIPCDTKKTYKVSDVLISDTKITAGNRYQNFDYSHFRHIEETIRPHKEYML